MKSIQVILVDDHTLFRAGLRSLLESMGGIEVVAEFGSAEAALEEVHRLSADILITDITMPGMSGIELTETLSQELSCIRVIILSMHDNQEFILQSLKAGARAYLPKDIPGTELREAIQEVARGGEYFNKQVSQTIMRSLMKRDTPEPVEKALTPRELEVLTLVADGLMNKEVADKLNISIRTVDCHKNSIMGKLKLNTTAELVKYAIRNKIIEI